jgi:hypothetical protein
MKQANRSALIIESPEPFDWLRLTVKLARLDETVQTFVDVADVLIVWSEDGTKALIALDEPAIPAGDYRLSFVYSLDIGPGAPVLRRSGSTLPEVAVLEFSLPHFD